MAISFIETDGGSLAVEVDGDGPLVLCSPALGDVRNVFDPLAAQLVAYGYRVARVDLRGHGDSTASFSHYGDEATAEDFLTVAEILGSGPAIFAGASMSAAAAVIAAGRRPDRVAGLVLIGPYLRNGMSAAMSRILSLALARPWGPMVWRAHAARLWPGLGPGAGERAAVTTEMLTRSGHWAAFRSTVRGADHRVVMPWLARVQAPALVVMGGADPDWKDPLAEAQWVASNFSDAETVVVPGAGHAPMLERPAIVCPAVLQYLTKIHFHSGRTRKSA